MMTMGGVAVMMMTMTTMAAAAAMTARAGAITPPLR
jgi:hypothetical protein